MLSPLRRLEDLRRREASIVPGADHWSTVLKQRGRLTLSSVDTTVSLLHTSLHKITGADLLILLVSV